MDAIGVIAEARNVAQSIVRRIENYRQGQKAFKTLRGHLAHLTQKIEEVNQLVRNFPGALPDNVCGLFNGTLECVRRSLFDLNETVEKDFSKAFATKTGSFLEYLKSKGYQVFRANALNNKMNTVETQLKDASNNLLHLIVMLANALKIDSRTIRESDKEKYRPAFCAPAVSHKIHFRL